MPERRITHELVDGRWEPTGQVPRDPDRANFLIVCGYGDWSGFRSLADCLAQVPNWQNKPLGFYHIEER